MKYIIFALILIIPTIAACSKPAAKWQYACVTPIGDVTITPDTDTGIKVYQGSLYATRSNKSIRIPFSQCVGLQGQ